MDLSILPNFFSAGKSITRISADKRLDPETLNASVSGDQLVISGEKKSLPKSVKSEFVHRSERSTGQFARSLSLSVSVQSEKVQASYTNGVLKILLPKMEEAKPKQIQVKLG
jgi:HSP20 family protein